MFLEIDGEMNVIESQDAWYWPIKKGIQRNPWHVWKKEALNAGFNVAILPMRDDIYKKFDVKKAVEWFKSVEGLPYGFHNFIFGWIDTPDKSFPPVADLEFVYMIFCFLERIWATPVTSFLGEAMNMRLNTTDLSLPEIAVEAHKRGLRVKDLFAMVEKDEWVYSDGYSMVCSSFVAAIYKAGGLFGDMEIQATEFTPRDIYQLNFFEKNYTKPERCQGVDPELPYCQIMGKHIMDVYTDDYSTIDPYEHMNEKCPSMAPKYEREPGC